MGVMDDEVDAVAEWVQAQARVIALAEEMTPAEAERRVPACPGWTVHQLLAHVIGLDSDVLAGDEPDDHNEAWTKAQVDARADHDIPTLLTEWRSTTDPLQQWMRTNTTRPLGDVVIHEQDLRGALDIAGARDTPGLAVLRDRMAGRLSGAVAAAGLAPAHLVGSDWRHETGPGEPGLVLQASTFDLTRALMTRRSAAQLRSWVTAGDVEPYLGVFAALGPLPEADLQH